MFKALMKVLTGKTLSQRLRSYVAKKSRPAPDLAVPEVSLKSMPIYEFGDSLATSGF
jgi:hypothetical protein